MSYSNPSPDYRRYARFEVLECAMIYPKEQDPIRAIVVDIGLGGVQLRSKMDLPIGEVCELHIGWGDGQILKLPGEARYSHSVEGSELKASGFRFLPSTHEQRIAVAEYVHSVFERQSDVLLP